MCPFIYSEVSYNKSSQCAPDDDIKTQIAPLEALYFDFRKWLSSRRDEICSNQRRGILERRDWF